jgi:PAS domain S-box-containing protein
MSSALENPLATNSLSTLLEAAPESVLLLDPSGRILMANAWAVESFGYSKKELIGRKVEDLLLPTSRGTYRRTLRGSFAHPGRKSEKHIPLVGRRKNGKQFPIELSLDAVKTGRDALGVLVICDVTERTQLEEELRATRDKLEERIRERTSELSLANRKLQREIHAHKQTEQNLRFMRDIIKSSDVAIIGRQLDGTIVSWNPAARRMYGYSAREMIGRSILTVVPPERLAQSRKLMASIRRGERLEHIEVESVKKNGERFPSVVTVSPVWNEQGKLIGASVIARDVTRRKRADAQIRYERDRAQRFLDIADVIILVLDRRGRVVQLNRKGCEVLGCREDKCDLLGRDWFSTCVPRAHRRRERETFLWRLSRESGGPRHYEHPVLTQSGQERLIAWHSIVLRDEDGRATGKLISGEDITERRAAEQALRQLTGRMLQVRDEERRSIARELHDSTAQRLALLMTQLGRAQRLGGEANGNRSGLLREARAVAGQALREVRTLAYLLHPPLLEEMGLVSALRVYIAGLQKNNKMRIGLDLPARLERLPRIIELSAFRIVQEALTNALRHASSPSARVKLLREGDSLVVRVIDHGRGLAKRASRVAGNGHRHVGMGLAGMRERVNLVNGRLDIRSGKSGTTVTAVIPVRGKRV